MFQDDVCIIADFPSVPYSPRPMALTIQTELNSVLLPGISKQILNILVGRKGVHFQVQATGNVWVRFEVLTDAIVDDSVLVRGGDIIDFDQLMTGVPNFSDLYEGRIDILWEGGYSLSGGVQPLASCNCRVLEMS